MSSTRSNGKRSALAEIADLLNVARIWLLRRSGGGGQRSGGHTPTSADSIAMQEEPSIRLIHNDRTLSLSPKKGSATLVATTKSKTTTTETDRATASHEAWQRAQAARQQAEAAYARAQDAQRAAVEHYASLKRRNDEGDETLSSLDLLTAEADLPRTHALTEARWRAVGEAQRIEAPLLVRCVADQVEANADALSLAGIREHQAAAAEQISAALAPLVREVGKHAAAYAEAAQMFKDAGVDRYNSYRKTPGGLTPTEAAAWRPEPEYAEPLAISLGDIPTTTLGETLTAALAEALAAIGQRLDIVNTWPLGTHVEVAPMPEPAADLVPNPEAEALERERIAELADWYTPSKRLVLSPQR